jgi:hypothetical protein
MLKLDWLVEQRILDAVERGEFDHLPGAGRPLQLDDDPSMREDLRLAYRILKNAGYAPPEVHYLREIADLRRWMAHAPDAESRRKALTRLSLLMTCLNARSGGGCTLDDPRYAQRLVAQFDREAAADARKGNDQT